MGIFKNIFWITSESARDVKYYLSDLFVKESFTAELTFVDSDRHIVYSNGIIEFDFCWQRGNRPTLFLRKNGVHIETTVYESLMKNHAPKQTIGEKIFYINSKLDKDIYYGEHHSFILNYIKNN